MRAKKSNSSLAPPPYPPLPPPHPTTKTHLPPPFLRLPIRLQGVQVLGDAIAPRVIAFAAANVRDRDPQVRNGAWLAFVSLLENPSELVVGPVTEVRPASNGTSHACGRTKRVSCV